MKYRYYICDVFTDKRFGGNPLAVLPHAEGLSGHQMQQIAREFNFSESTFVFPPEDAGHTRRVRIFTPTTEVPFAGHPNVGTAFVLATSGELGPPGSALTVTFEEKAGVVPVAIHQREGEATWCELEAPERLSLGKSVPAEVLAPALCLSAEDFAIETHDPRVGSVGLPFLIAELRDRSALERARINLHELEALVAEGVPPDIHVYTHAHDGFDLRARMFAPLDGVPEDPATGSASCALAGLLAEHDPSPSASLSWRIAQGVEMGRPSTLIARAEKKDRVVIGTWVGGASVLVSEGVIHID